MSYPGVPKSRWRNIAMSLDDIAVLLRSGNLTKSPLAKTSDVWTDGKDSAKKDAHRPGLYIVELLRHNVPTPMLWHQGPDDTQFEILDGCNRIDAIEQFLNSDLGIPESKFFADRPRSQKIVTFKEMAPAVQRELLTEIRFPITVYPHDTPERALRRVVCWPHMVADLLFGEEVLLHDAIPVARLLIEVNRDAHKMEKKGPWRVKRQAMMIAWIRTAAMVFDDNLHLSDNHIPCRQWLLDREHAAPPPPFQVHVFRQICALTVEVYYHWSARATAAQAEFKKKGIVAAADADHLKSMVGSLVVFVDIAWLFYHYGPPPAAADTPAPMLPHPPKDSRARVIPSSPQMSG